MTMADTVAVMNEGRIEQMGPPEILYDLPRTPFVANFLGQTNLIPVTYGGRDGEWQRVSASGRTFQVAAARTNETSGALALGVRPEKVRIHETEPDGRAGLTSVIGPGTVADVSFTGVSTQYLVDVPGFGRWGVFEQNLDVERIDTRVGDTAWLSWDAGHSFVVTGGEELHAGMETIDEAAP